MGITYTSSGAFKTKQKLSNFEQKFRIRIYISETEKSAQFLDFHYKEGGMCFSRLGAFQLAPQAGNLLCGLSATTYFQKCGQNTVISSSQNSLINRIEIVVRTIINQLRDRLNPITRKSIRGVSPHPANQRYIFIFSFSGNQAGRR